MCISKTGGNLDWFAYPFGPRNKSQVGTGRKHIFLQLQCCTVLRTANKTALPTVLLLSREYYAEVGFRVPLLPHSLFCRNLVTDVSGSQRTSHSILKFFLWLVDPTHTQDSIKRIMKTFVKVHKPSYGSVRKKGILLTRFRIDYIMPIQEDLNSYSVI
jgi:hypothetical protein